MLWARALEAARGRGGGVGPWCSERREGLAYVCVPFATQMKTWVDEAGIVVSFRISLSSKSPADWSRGAQGRGWSSSMGRAGDRSRSDRRISIAFFARPQLGFRKFNWVFQSDLSMLRDAR